MKRSILFSLFLGSIAFTGHLLSTHAQAQAATDALTPATLKSTIAGLGYEIKDLSTTAGSEKYEFTIVASGFNFPISAEISPSKAYCWFTLFMGTTKATTPYQELLEKNAEVQPCQFYVTSKGNLMMGLALENRGPTPAMLRKAIDFLSAQAAKTSTTWSK